MQYQSKWKEKTSHSILEVSWFPYMHRTREEWAVIGLLPSYRRLCSKLLLQRLSLKKKCVALATAGVKDPQTETWCTEQKYLQRHFMKWSIFQGIKLLYATSHSTGNVPFCSTLKLVKICPYEYWHDWNSLFYLLKSVF